MASKPAFNPKLHLINNINTSKNIKKTLTFRSKERTVSREQQNDWSQQEDAFFDQNETTNVSNLIGSVGSLNSATRRDFELARRLQDEIELEDNKTEENDLAFAKMIQSQEEEYSDTYKSYNNANNEIPDAEHAKTLEGQYAGMNRLRDDGVAIGEGTNDEDLDMAIIMQNLEALGKGNFTSNRRINDNDGENMTLDEMRKLLEEAQEERTGTVKVNNKKSGLKQEKGIMNSFRKGLVTILHRSGNDNLSPKNGRTNDNIPSMQVPKCSVCNETARHYLTALGKTFHPSCFRCVGCGEVIPSGEPFAFKKNDDGEKFPLHRKCHSTLYGLKCTVCRESIPYAENGSVSYVKHPFFTSELMCPKHADNPGRRCTSCNRFEPIGPGNFVDLNDNDRCICHACCTSVIVDSEDAKPLYDSVLNFFEHQLALPIWPNMHDIPVLIVASDTINSSSENSGHNNSTQILTRGLCLSEHQCGRKIALRRMTYDKANSSFRSIYDQKNDFSFFEVPDIAEASSNATVTAILCLTGLPKDLTASILAHETTHAWLKLHPHFNASQPIPLQVEEGVCQLVAHLFLNDGLEPPSTTVTDGLSDQKLRQYFKFSIEADESEIYGDGFRIAAKIYAAIGIYELLNHIAIHRTFPQL